MGLLNNTLGAGLNAAGLGSITRREVPKPSYASGDFPGGLEIIEIINGKAAELDKIVLAGTFAPLQPFGFGGTQRLVKENYPGSSEPTVQVLGPEEDDTTVKGVLKTKFFKDLSLETAAVEFQELIDAMRIRGNLVRITLGEWRRYGFIQQSKFNLKTLREIEYEIKFTIIGVNPPTNYKFTSRADDDLIGPNKEITNKAAAAAAAGKNFPTEMPRTIAEAIGDAIDTVASAISNVTGFVSIIEDSEQLLQSANRAIGLIKYARVSISSSSRRIGQISKSAASLGSNFTYEAEKTVAQIKSAKHISTVKSDFNSLSALLASLQSRFAGLASTIPMYRHLVREGDTLQGLSIKYYNTSGNWKKIYDHNKLTSTYLVRGTVLEIPRP